MHTMRGEKHELVLHQRKHVLFELQLCFDIQMCGRFVEYQYTSFVVQEGSSKRDALCLSAAEGMTAFPNNSVDPFR